MFQALQDLLARMNVDPSLRVVVFESANHDFYLSHFDLTGKLGNVMTAVGPSGLPVLVDTFVRISRSPVVSIAKIRGCVRGACSELCSLATCGLRRAKTRAWVNPKLESDCIPGAVERNVPTFGGSRSRAGNRSRRERLRRRHRGTIRIRHRHSRRGVGRLRRRARAPDSLLRPASYRGGEESH